MNESWIGIVQFVELWKFIRMIPKWPPFHGIFRWKSFSKFSRGLLRRWAASGKVRTEPSSFLGTVLCLWKFWDFGFRIIMLVTFFVINTFFCNESISQNCDKKRSTHLTVDISGHQKSNRNFLLERFSTKPEHTFPLVMNWPLVMGWTVQPEPLYAFGSKFLTVTNDDSLLSWIRVIKHTDFDS